MYDRKVALQFRYDLFGPVQVLSFDKPTVGLPVPFFKVALGGDTPGQSVGEATLTWYYH